MGMSVLCDFNGLPLLFKGIYTSEVVVGSRVSVVFILFRYPYIRAYIFIHDAQITVLKFT